MATRMVWSLREGEQQLRELGNLANQQSAWYFSSVLDLWWSVESLLQWEAGIQQVGGHWTWDSVRETLRQ